MGMKKSFGLMAMALGAMGGLEGMAGYNYSARKRSDNQIDFTPPKKIIPKGCQEYDFALNGEIIYLVANSQKSANKKFQKLLNKSNVV